MEVGGVDPDRFAEEAFYRFGGTRVEFEVEVVSKGGLVDSVYELVVEPVRFEGRLAFGTVDEHVVE